LDIGSNLRAISNSSKRGLFLNAYDERGLFRLLEKVGLINYLNSLGFRVLKLKIEIDDADIHTLRVYNNSFDPMNLLLDLRLSEAVFVPDYGYSGNKISYNMIMIEWLSSQNANSGFRAGKPQLPGQKYPGLGILDYCFKMMKLVARDINRDGFLDMPDHFHGAMMYAKKFKFFDPVAEGSLRAILRDLKNYSMNDISWGVITGSICNRSNGSRFDYRPAEQIYYVSERLRGYFHAKFYKKLFSKTYKENRYVFDYESMLMQKAIKLTKSDLSEL
jgi:hypothetical protein